MPMLQSCANQTEEQWQTGCTKMSPMLGSVTFYSCLVATEVFLIFAFFVIVIGNEHTCGPKTIY